MQDKQGVDSSEMLVMRQGEAAAAEASSLPCFTLCHQQFTNHDASRHLHPGRMPKVRGKVTAVLPRAMWLLQMLSRRIAVGGGEQSPSESTRVPSCTTRHTPAALSAVGPASLNRTCGRF